jgi:hypothetical protein
MSSSSSRRFGLVFQQERLAFQHCPRPGFDGYAGPAGQPECVDQALHAPLVDPVIDRLARYPADPRCRSWPACEPDRRCNEVRPADLGFFHCCAALFFAGACGGWAANASNLLTPKSVSFERRVLPYTSNHPGNKLPLVAVYWRLEGSQVASLRVDTKARQSYLTSRLKEVQIGHENYA